MCGNDKVIQNIKDLIENNRLEKQAKKAQFEENQKMLKNLDQQVEQIKSSQEEVDKQELGDLETLESELKLLEARVGQSSELRKDYKKARKAKELKEAEIKKNNFARKTALHV